MTPPKGKQRSIHMDDETFDILERLASEYKANNSTIVRMALIQFDKGSGSPRATPAQVEAVLYGGAPVVQMIVPEPANPKHIVLPDAAISSFKVVGSTVQGRRPRRPEEDDGLDV